MTLLPRVTFKLQYLPFILVSSYALFIALILNPQIQAHNVFLHRINIPFHFDISKPEKIKSLPFGRVRNFYTETIDGVRISGWHLLPDEYNVKTSSSSREDLFDEAIQERATLIYFHGNAANRAAPFRIQAYAEFTRLGLNVVAIDYRGFGDSKGTPSEEGLYRDARATYKWIRQIQSSFHLHDKESSPAVYIAGQSLGTGVATRLALDLYRVGQQPHTIFLIAPYTSIRNLLTSYKIGGLFPLFWPLGLCKVLSDLTDKYLYTRFDSQKVLYQLTRQASLDDEESEQMGNLDYTLSRIDLAQELGLLLRHDESTERDRISPPNIIIAHADNDAVIPNAHGKSLFDTITSASRRTAGGMQEIEKVDHQWGSTLTLQDKNANRSYILVKSHRGGHNGFPHHAIDVFSKVAGLIRGVQ